MALITSAGGAPTPAQSLHVVRLATAMPRACVAIPVGHTLEVVLDRDLLERVAVGRVRITSNGPVYMASLRAQRARDLLHATSKRKDVLGCRINDVVMRNRRNQQVAPDWVYLVWTLFRHGDVGVWNGATRSFLARAEEADMDEHCRKGFDGFFILQTLDRVMLLSAQTCHADPPRRQLVTVDATIDRAYRKAHPPQLPPAAVARHAEGTVVLRVEVGPQGKVRDVVVDRDATHAAHGLVAAVVRAARHWRYNPAVVDAVPVTGWLRLRVVFPLPVPGPSELPNGGPAVPASKSHSD